MRSTKKSSKVIALNIIGYIFLLGAGAVWFLNDEKSIFAIQNPYASYGILFSLLAAPVFFKLASDQVVKEKINSTVSKFGTILSTATLLILFFVTVSIFVLIELIKHIQAPY